MFQDVELVLQDVELMFQDVEDKTPSSGKTFSSPFQHKFSPARKENTIFFRHSEKKHYLRRRYGL